MDAVFNTKAHIYYRPAGINEEYVYRIPVLPEGIFTEMGRQVYGEYKGGNKEMLGNFIDEVEKEQEWVSMLMETRLQDRKVNKSKDKIRQQVRSERPDQVRFKVPYRWLGGSASSCRFCQTRTC